MSATVEVLEQARALIEDESRWCQGWFAKTAAGEEVYSLHPEACEWCALGALSYVDAPEAARSLLSECATEIVGSRRRSAAISKVNDTTDHATVLSMFDCAIAKAKGESDG